MTKATHEVNVDQENAWMTTYHGRFDFETAEQIDIRDIIRGLAHQVRYQGQTSEPYTIAQHSVACHQLARYHHLPPQVRRAALLHDAAEAYVGDLSRPLRRKLGDSYEAIEADVLRMIAEKYDFPYPLPETVKEIDNLIYQAERRGISHHDLIDASSSWEPPRGVQITLSGYWTAQKARRKFANRVEESGVDADVPVFQ